MTFPDAANLYRTVFGDGLPRVPDREQILRSLSTKFPDILRAICPRVYVGASGWCHPATPAAFFGVECALVSANPNVRPSDPKSTLLAMCGAGKLAAAKVPTFHVGRDLVAAVELSSPPVDSTWADLPIPHDAGLFLLPDGAIRCREGRSWGWFAWVRFRRDEQIRLPGLWDTTQAIAADNQTDLFTLYTGSFKPNGQHDGIITWSAGIDQTPMPGADETAEYTNLDGSEVEIIDRMRRVVTGLFYAMAARPVLIERTSERMKKATKSDPREEWTPNWIGRTYRIQRADGGGTHASPRLHWRRGHYRQQPCGTGRKENKIIWIEPHMVGGGT